MTSGVPAIRFEDVWKVYRMGKIEFPALRGVTLSIESGDFVAIVGPSGSGKSTLLHIAGALDKPTRGRVLIDGIDVSVLNDAELSRLRNRTIGFVFQAYNLIPRLTAKQNVELPLMLRGVPPGEREELAAKMLELVGLSSKLNNKPTELSGGEQQRVAIARAVVTNPKILLCDEPTGNLDSKSAEDVMNVIKDINKRYGSTVVVVTHNMEIAESARRVIRLKDGMVYEGA
ncbi:MAG: macrolide ABC transporter ATP-binding protein [Candidatus Terraquivivens tikiterensis]|uniref:Macrolide ABC transporter ATP-binding protein n=1 Tax=Candidatus Terraquivivens tikiterensis TaxID=1980982 RepID=A0A2R7Y1S9_9ARCH|nr:MAG: macrolide ABC transporter ATP-binding protein [Candidatus Terraquivivens tikiterensis]